MPENEFRIITPIHRSRQIWQIAALKFSKREPIWALHSMAMAIASASSMHRGRLSPPIGCSSYWRAMRSPSPRIRRYWAMSNVLNLRSTILRNTAARRV